MKVNSTKLFVIISMATFIVLSGCQSSNKNNAHDTVTRPGKDAVQSSDSSSKGKDQAQKDSVKSISTPASQAVETAKNYLQTTYKDDLAKGLIDTLSRKFIVQEFNLKGDAEKEIFIGLGGPYFCGSGGCTCILLSPQGKLITLFTVTQFPLIISSEKTKGWANLFIESNSNYHEVKFNGTKYPSNPSTQPVVKAPVGGDIIKVLDEGQKQTRYSF